jgi:CO/xanthine dehydrogenase Mo-binding subunit
MSRPHDQGPARRGTPSLLANPRLGDWITITPDGRVLVRSGKVELGQGITTALAQIVADELDVDPRRVALQPVRTGTSPDEGLTSGSMSVQHSGDALPEVSARVRAIYLAEAAAELGRSPDELTITDGEIRADYGGYVSYWSLADDRLLDIEIGDAPAAVVRDPGGYRSVGRSAPRVDGAAKIFGRPAYIHDLRFPGQLFGRVVRPPARVARLESVDDAALRSRAGVVDVVRDGDFLAVVAEDEATAVAACTELAAACTWSVTDSLPDQAALPDYLMSAPAVTETVFEKGQPEADGDRTLTRRFTRGYVEHASLAPSCGVAVWTDDELHVWSHSQGIYRLRQELAREFAIPEGRVVVTFAESAGCYGHNAADDAAFDAALLARRVPGRHVQVVWSRHDEHTWEPFGPAMVTEIRVSVDESGSVAAWHQEVWGNGHVSRPSSEGLPPLLGAQFRAEPLAPVPAVEPPFKTGGGMSRNSVPLYDIPSVTAVMHRLTEMPLRTSALRALGAHLNVYAIESVIDELAEAAGQDPIAYRLDRLTDERARAVLEAVAERSGWWGRTPGDDVGRGVGFARYKNAGGYCAVVAEIEAESEVLVTRLTIAADVGLVVNPDGVRNQVEGGAIQAVSWTTLEQVRFDLAQVTSRDWETYPILRFEQVPAVDIVLIDRPDQPTLGSGEMAAGPTAAAIGNAVADALGVRVRTLPLTPDAVMAAMP